MTIDELAAGELLVKYKSAELLRSESRAISAWLSAELERANHVTALARAVISGNEAVLAKGMGPDIEQARADVAALRRRFAKECEKFGDGFISNLAAAHRLAELVKEYARRTQAHEDDVARSRRFNAALMAAPLTSVHSNAVN